MRLLAYELLTQTIILLGLLRGRIVGNGALVLKARVFDLYDREYSECCDCGLEHKQEWFGPDKDCGHMPAPNAAHLHIVGHAYPARPRGYTYRLRFGAGKPSLAVPK